MGLSPKPVSISITESIKLFVKQVTDANLCSPRFHLESVGDGRGEVDV